MTKQISLIPSTDTTLKKQDPLTYGHVLTVWPKWAWLVLIFMVSVSCSTVWAEGCVKVTIPTKTQVGATCLPDEMVPVQAPFPMPPFTKPQFPSFTVTIIENGAKENELATQAIQASIDAVSSKGDGKVVIPAGKWLTGRITLKSNVNLNIAEGAEVSFRGNLEDYRPAVFTRNEGVEG